MIVFASLLWLVSERNDFSKEKYDYDYRIVEAREFSKNNDVHG